MEQKKNKKYELEHKRPLFFGIGMIISLSLTLVAFEWKSPVDPLIVCPYPVTDDFDEIIIPPTSIDPPPPPQKAVIIKTVEKEPEEVEVIIDDNILEDDIVEFVPPPEIPVEKPEEAIRSFAEVMPTYEGGMQSFYSFLSKEINYPKAAKRMGVQGKVFVQFVVETDGTLTDLKIVKGIGAGCDEEALRVMGLIPRFIPAKQGDVRVPVKMIIPINFKLE